MKSHMPNSRSKSSCSEGCMPKSTHFYLKGWSSLGHKHNISITSENTRDISISISRNIRRTNPLICLMLFSLAHKHKHKRISVKAWSHLCDKHNTSDISISISTRKKEHVPFFLCLCLCLCLCRLCYAYRTSVNQA